MAQRQRLNGLTTRNRNRAAIEHQRMEESSQQYLLNDTNPDSLAQQDLTSVSSVVQHTPVASVSLPQPLVDNIAPPPYEYYANRSKSPEPVDSELGAPNDQKNLVPGKKSGTPASTVPDSTNPEESSKVPVGKKQRRPIWKTFMKRSSNREPSNGKVGSTESQENNLLPASTLPVGTDKHVDQPQDVSAAIVTSPRQETDFDLRQSMSGLSIPIHTTSLSDRETLGIAELSVGSPNNSTSSSGLEHLPSAESPAPNATNFNPYKQMRLEAQSRLESNVPRPKPSYQNPRSDSSDSFFRLRPSERVRGTQQPLQSKDRVASPPPPDGEPLSRQSTGGNRLGSSAFDSTSNVQQTWQTTTLNGRTLKLKIQFDPESFTNRISLPAAQALGVSDSIEEFAGTAITNLMLLYTISDGLSTEANTVLGDMVEFTVMDEHESRIPTIVLGAPSAYLARIAEEGQYIYWSPRHVPENVRVVENLRLYRRFELVRW